MEIGAAAGVNPDPLELLLATRPKGVICFFSAVVFHSLTTQPVRHHHIAELQPSGHGEARKGEEVPAQTENQTAPVHVSTASVAPRLGKLLFAYEGVSYYFTRRSERLVPGVQSRAYGPRTEIKITTLEQTLLDTLYKPFHCGGPEVVFEVWQEAWTSNRVDEERMVDYLQRMQYPATARRLGVMLEIIDQKPGRELRQLLDEVRHGIDPASPFVRISLLPGIAYTNLHMEWLVNTP